MQQMVPPHPTSFACARAFRNDWLSFAAGQPDRIAAAAAALTAGLDDAALAALDHDWDIFARDDQTPPPGDWRLWLFMGGRGAGKTRAGAEWVRGLVAGRDGYATVPAGRIALVGETYADVREVMVDGPSGLLAVHPPGERPAFEVSRRRVLWPNGAVAYAFSAEDPEALRGPQCDAAWCDEAAKWPHALETWDMLQFGLRLGPAPRALVTTTPRPTPLMRRLLAHPRLALTRARTADNAANLAPAFLDEVTRAYAGTALGRQELDGELIADTAGALFTRALIEAARVAVVPELVRVVVAVDPPASSKPGADACGIVAAGIDAQGQVYVLADGSLEQATPAAWAARAAALFHAHDADAIVAEINQGGEMVAAVMRQIDPTAPVTPVRATRGKRLRAEPVAALYAQGRVRHAGRFPALEDEMCSFTGLARGETSPDRLDALVWAITALALTRQGEPRVRGV